MASEKLKAEDVRDCHVQMSVNDYSARASETAVYPEELGLLYCALGLCAEAGEAAEFVKKSVRDAGKGGELKGKRRMDLIKELGDVALYWSQLCMEVGISPAAVLYFNLQKLAKRKEDGTIHGHGNDR